MRGNSVDSFFSRMEIFHKYPPAGGFEYRQSGLRSARYPAKHLHKSGIVPRGEAPHQEGVAGTLFVDRLCTIGVSRKMPRIRLEQSASYG
jgi:hypothetical protein